MKLLKLYRRHTGSIKDVNDSRNKTKKDKQPSSFRITTDAISR